MCFLFSIREARTLTVAIGAARLALRALEGKMVSAVLSPHVLPGTTFQHLVELLVKIGIASQKLEGIW